MNSLLILFIILFLLTVSLHKSGLRNLFSLLFNLAAIFALIMLVSWGMNAILATVIISPLILMLTTFMTTDNDKQAAIAFKSSIIVFAGLLVVIFLVQFIGQFQGFDIQDNDALENLSVSVGLNFSDIAIAVMALSILGAIAEAAIAVTADLSELTEQAEMTLSALTEERQLISQQIIGTSINTLFFGVLGSSLGLIIWFVSLHEPVAQIINSKLLMLDAAVMLLGFLGIIFASVLAGMLVVRDFQK